MQGYRRSRRKRVSVRNCGGWGRCCVRFRVVVITSYQHIAQRSRILSFVIVTASQIFFAGSYQQQGTCDGKKAGTKTGGGASGGKLGDQPVVFHKSIKSSGYGKEQPVLPLRLPASLLADPLTGHAHVWRQSASSQEKTLILWGCRGSGDVAV